MSSQNNREREIFMSALRLASGDERDAFLAEACGSNKLLRSGIESLLKISEEGYGESFLQPVSTDKLVAEVSAASAEVPREKGFVLGDYELEELLGRGSTGDVYRARQISLDRLVAVKILRGSFLLSESNRLRFRQEAESAAKLEHPNIVPVYEVNEEDGQLFFAMKLISGGSLAGRMGDFQKDIRKAVELLVKVADTLQVAHQQGIIHRDVKPGNILLDETGEPFLTDFGLAKVSGREEAFTLTGQIVGTPAYMAPEQADDDAVTTLVDVYSCGAILYEFLAGRVPFQGDSILGTLEKVRNENAVPLSRLQSGVDKDLEVIALKCLEKDPSQRFQSARRLASELRRWLKGEPILSRPVPATVHFVRWCRRNPSRAVLSGFAVVLTLVLAIGGPLLALEQRRLRNKAKQRTFLAETRLAFQLAEQPDGIPLIRQYVKRWRKKRNIDMDTWEQRYLKGLLARPVFSTPRRASERTIPYWSPDGSKILIQYRRTGELELWNWKNSQLLWKTNSLAGGVPEWDPGGDSISYTTFDFKRYILHPESGKIDVVESPGLPGGSARFALVRSADGRYLAYPENSERRPVRVWDMKNLQFANPPETRNVERNLSWNPRQNWLAWGGLYRGSKMWDPDTKELIEIDPPDPRGGTYGLAWHPEKPLISTGGGDWIVRVRTMPQGNLLSELKGHTGKVMSCAWSHDGKWLASGGEDHSVKIWDVEKGNSVATFSEHAEPVTQLSWAPGAPLLASGSMDGSVRVWDFKSIVNVELPIKDRTGYADWSPDSAKIVVKGTAPNSQAAIWDLKSGAVTELIEAKGWVNSLCWNDKTNRILIGSANNKPLRIFDLSGDDPRELEAGFIAGTKEEKRGGYGMAGWNPDGTRIAMITKGGLDLITYPGGSRTRLEQKGFQVRRAVWSPGGNLIAVAGRKNEVQIWDVDEHLPPEIISTDDLPVRITWSPDGQRLAIADNRFEIRIRDRRQKEWMKSLRGHTRRITSLSWSPDGRRLASAGSDHTVRIWDADSSELLAILRRHTNEVEVVSWSPDGQKLLSVGRDKVIIWDGSPIKTKKS